MIFVKTKHYLIITIISILIINLLFSSCKTLVERYSLETSKSLEMRIKLKTITLPITIKNNKSIIIEDSITKYRYKLKYSEDIIVIKNDGKIYLNEFVINTPISIYSKKKSLVEINNKSYFGEIRIMPADEVVVMNYIPIETYLLSVLPSEVPVYFNIEAMKAQAVIARTYSFHFAKKNRDNLFDVDDTTSYQVYNGFGRIEESNIKKIYKAGSETKGMIIEYKDEPIVAYFHSNSGGRTKSAKEYFGAHSDFSYLVSKDDPYSVDEPGYSWSFELDKKEIKNLFNNEINITEDNIINNENDFVSSIKINNIEYSAKQIRRIIGYSKVRSETFRLKINDDCYLFEGYGYGHGVGLSQWGANRMGKSGFKFYEIINFYYPNTVLNYY